MHAAYHRGPATSAASSFRGSVPATLLGSECLHAPAAPRLALAKPPPTRYSPACNCRSPHHTSASMHSQRLQAPAHCAAARRCTQRTTEVQRRQLRHPSETRCQRRCTSCFDLIVCTHRRPSANPSANPHPPAPAPCATASAHSTQHHPCTVGVGKHQLTLQLPGDAHSVPLRSSEVSCGIPSRLGASDAAPSARISLTASTAAPQLAPRIDPTHPLQPRAHPPQPTARSINHAQPAFASKRSQRSCPPTHAAYC